MELAPFKYETINVATDLCITAFHFVKRQDSLTFFVKGSVAWNTTCSFHLYVLCHCRRASINLIPVGLLLACNWRHGSHAGGQQQSVFLRWELNFFIMQILRKSFLLFWPPTWPPCHVVASDQFGNSGSIFYRHDIDLSKQPKYGESPKQIVTKIQS